MGKKVDFLDDSKKFRLFAVSKRLDNYGIHRLVPFNSDEFNQEFDEDCIDDELERLCGYLYGGAKCFEISDDICDYEGNIYIQFDPNNRNKNVIRDITGKIDTDPGNSKYYIFFNRRMRKEYLWVVVKQMPPPPRNHAYTGTF